MPKILKISGSCLVCCKMKNNIWTRLMNEIKDKRSVCNISDEYISNRGRVGLIACDTYHSNTFRVKCSRKMTTKKTSDSGNQCHFHMNHIYLITLR